MAANFYVAFSVHNQRAPSDLAIPCPLPLERAWKRHIKILLGSRRVYSFLFSRSHKNKQHQTVVSATYQADNKRNLQSIKAFFESWLSLLWPDQFPEESKTNRTWLKLLVAEISVLQGVFGKRNEQYGPRHFLKIGVEKKANKHPWL